MIGIRSRQADGAAAQANDLYWHSNRTVEDIASELGVTRSGLYASLVPLEAGEKCPACGGRLGYTTRTARTAGTVTCEGCGLTSQLAEDKGRTSLRDREIAAAARRRRLPIPRGRVVLIGGAATLGAVLGTVLACAIRDA